MVKYDFHGLLGDEEFEALAVDIIAERECVDSNTIRRYPKGRDGGIDGYWHEENLVIQAKCYKDDFNVLYNSLKKEIEKIKKIKPTRYILVTSVSLTKMNQEKILNLFEGYIKSFDDILGKIELNIYLQDEKYYHIGRKYQNLWMPNTEILNHILENTLLREQFNYHHFNLKDFEDNVDNYIRTDVFYQSISYLNARNFLLIYGEPGIGKTMLGYNLAIHHLTKNKSLQIFFLDNVEELLKVYNSDKEQFFIIDDFLGINRLNNQLSYNESKIYRVLRRVMEDVRHKIVLISRKNIYAEGLKTLPDLGRIVGDSYVEITSHTLTIDDKKNILKSLIEKSNLTYNSISNICFLSDDIIEHKNFNPRIITDTIKYLVTADKNDISEGKEIIKALTTPFEMYEKIFFQLKNASQSSVYLGLCLAVFGRPVEKNVLKKCYGDMQAGLPHKEWESFDDALTHLEAAFCYYRKIGFKMSGLFSFVEVDKSIVGFRNHTMLEYWETIIEGNLSSYGVDIIRSVNLMNVSLFFTKDNKFLNDDTILELDRIIIPEIINKVKKEYSKLDFLYLGGLEFSCADMDEYEEDFHLSSDYTDSRLLKLKQILNLDKTFKSKELKVVIEELKVELFNKISSNDIFDFTEEELYMIPDIISELIIQGFEVLDMKQILDKYISEMNFLKYYISFYDFKEIYGERFDVYLQENYDKIINNIITLLHTDYTHYIEDNEEEKIDMLLFYDFPEVIKLYEVKIHKETLAIIRKFEKSIMFDGYSIKWDRQSNCFEHVERGSIKRNEIIEQQEDSDDERFQLVDELLPKNIFIDESWGEFCSRLEESREDKEVLNRIHEDFFRNGTKWSGDEDDFNLQFGKILMEEYRNGNELGTSIKAFFDLMFKKVNIEEIVFLTKVATILKNRNEDFFNQKDIEIKKQLSSEEWDKVWHSRYIGYDNGWYYFVAKEIQIYLLCKNNDLKSEAENFESMAKWIIESDMPYLNNYYRILTDFFEEESKTYFLTHVEPFLNKARKFDGLQQLIFCLSEVYECQEINSDDTCESIISDFVLYRLLEMLDVQFTMCIEDAVRDGFENLAADNQYETHTFNYLEILREPSKIFEYYNENMAIIVEDDLNKIETFISNLETDN